MLLLTSLLTVSLPIYLSGNNDVTRNYRISTCPSVGVHCLLVFCFHVFVSCTFVRVFGFIKKIHCFFVRCDPFSVLGCCSECCVVPVKGNEVIMVTALRTGKWTGDYLNKETQNQSRVDKGAYLIYCPLIVLSMYHILIPVITRKVYGSLSERSPYCCSTELRVR